mgnify:CR=1 FL=1
METRIGNWNQDSLQHTTQYLLMIKLSNNQEYNEIVLCYVTFFEFRIMFTSKDCNLKYFGISLSNLFFIFNNKQHKNVKLKQYPKQLKVFMNVQ